ncbi:peptide/nickel transport system ATP-binding protein [Enhydrobacter aerosaccus]|uniref:Peptide/nickel transport system ATP-binding protein n=1 Tax=Enhydrobacter aerosaccus TaxID=225324 RepID=A0A1T4NSS8_9HYPH|nr:ABC transporter ATP-binding protein [Enhydrobacter aerosaccus]SJZ82380.1 peptide/nickel transport system ATP-binding protein [Enhydrobacter aerosaccus]
MNGSLLVVRDLHVAFHTRGGVVDAVRGIGLELAAGDTLAIVGESGSGKSVTAYSVMQLLDRSARIKQGQIVFRGEDITRPAPARMKTLRGAAISMVFQSPRTALNPIRPIGRQIMDALSAHNAAPEAELRNRALELLEAVRIRDAESRFDAYPEQLSGGMCQRVMIAMAIACNPALLIADEPTTGLDVTTQKTVMDLLTRLIAERNMGLILITHDLGLAARYCRNVMVMEKGQVVERAPTLELFSNPTHPYTRKLVAASPTFDSTVNDLVGAPPAAPIVRPPEERGTPLLLDVQAVTKRYSGSPVVDQVSLTMKRGESVGLVGESGSGKSTLSRMICRLIDHDGGSVVFDGEDIGDVPARDFHASPLRRDIQIVFQDPHESLNPRFSAFDCIAHPVRRLLKIKDGAELRRRVEEVAERCGLPRRLLSRFPHQLSGGEKARVGIARAIAVGPRLLVLDEPTAALDVSVQAVVLKLLDDLRRDSGLAFLFVSHDLNVVRMMCERIVVMRRGTVVEEGESDVLFRAPRTDYTRDLLAAIPHFEHRLQAAS